MRGLSNDLWSKKPIASPVMLITAPCKLMFTFVSLRDVD